MVADIPVTKDNVKERIAIKDKFFNVIFIDVNSFTLDLCFCSVLLYLYDNTKYFSVGYSGLTGSLQSDFCYIKGLYQKPYNFLKERNERIVCIQILAKQGNTAVSIDFLLKKTYHIHSCEHFMP